MTAQPLDLLPFATDPTYPAGSEAWSGLARRVAPSSGEAAAGLVPGDLVPAEWINHFLGVLSEHVQALADVPALNWSVAYTPDTTFPFAGTVRRQIGAALNSALVPVLVVRHVSVTALLRSLDGLTWAAGASVDGANTIDHFWAADERGAGDVIAISSTSGKSYRSSDAGATWDAGITLGSTGNWGKICRAWSLPGAPCFAVGTNKIRKAATVPASWSAQTVPGAAATYVPDGIFTAYAGESGVGVAVTNANIDGRRYIYTLDGTTWTEAGVHAASDGAVRAFTWSESHGKWFALTQTGRIFSAATLAGPWTKDAEMAMPSGTDRYYDIAAFGRNLVIVGGGGGIQGDPGLGFYGNMVVTDLTTFRTLQVGLSGALTALWRFNGQVFAAYAVTEAAHSDPSLFAALSMRAPFGWST